ncbi:hypothetical protein L873DRAFT_894091 [Choiromyces venosus 120613-1]|uniref:Uncharacterized protein n=1 Tax=Choiromyces venosus 120613-1 TaxID=1336337 RepID=A0A3N4K107_9PEZI|nr:hypothetical protein L873DRAFT_894091 [Choiromyces venosus 120613-1]
MQHSRSFTDTVVSSEFASRTLRWPNLYLLFILKLVSLLKSDTVFWFACQISCQIWCADLRFEVLSCLLLLIALSEGGFQFSGPDVKKF